MVFLACFVLVDFTRNMVNVNTVAMFTVEYLRKLDTVEILLPFF